MRLQDTDLAGADLTDADLTGARLLRGSLQGAVLTGSKWTRAALLGTAVPDELAASPELSAAAVAGRDPADVMIQLGGQARTVAFSPDGALLAIGMADVVQVTDMAGGRALRILHTGPACTVAFSPGGTLLATASDDHTARIWDLASGTTRTTLEGHTDWVNSVAFSPDGALLATASDDHTARIWDLADGTTRTTLQGHDGSVNGVAFSPDGTLLATVSADSTVRIWDVSTGQPLITLAEFLEGGYAALFAGGYKLRGDVGNDLRWAIKLCRFAPGELDLYVPGLRRLSLEEPIPLLPGPASGGR